MNEVYIFDLDGTLADIEHRRHFVTNGNNQWDMFYRQCFNDVPNVSVVKTYKILQESGHQLYIFSGRSDVVRSKTIYWLRCHEIYYEKLLMRDHTDYTPDDELKRAWLYQLINEHHFTKSNIIAVFDDRKKVVDMWRREGLTCFQVASGDF